MCLHSEGASYTCQPFLNGLISMIVTTSLCVLLGNGLPVRVNMVERNNGQALSQQEHRLLPNGSLSRHPGESPLHTRPRTYQKIVALLADPTWSVNRIAQVCKVGEHSVVGVREREASTIEERKKRLASTLVDVATLGAEDR